MTHGRQVIGTSASAIRTKRLIISEISENDGDIRDLFADREVMRYYPHLNLRVLADNWIAFCRGQISEHGFAPLIVRTLDGEMIGTCGPLHHVIDGSSEIESVCFFRRCFWTGGYTREACLATLVWMDETHDIRGSIGLIDPLNRPSIIHAIRCGFRYERDIVYLGRNMKLFRHANNPVMTVTNSTTRTFALSTIQRKVES